MNQIRRFKAENFIAFTSFAALNTMAIPLLLSKGFAPSSIGIISALFTISGLISNYVMGYFCDKLGTIKKVYRSSLTVLGPIIILLFVVNIKVVFVMFYVIAGFFQSAVWNLSDAWVIEYSDKTKEKYGQIRAYGSLGWALCSLTIGYIIDYVGFKVIGIVYITMILGLFLITRGIEDCKKKPTEIKKTDIMALIKIPKYRFFLLCLLIYAIGQTSMAYLPTYLIKSLGGRNIDIGIYNFVAAGSEIVVMYLSMEILHKVCEEKLFFISSMALIMRLIIMFFSKNVFMVYFTGIFHMVTFGAFLISSKNIIDKLTPIQLRTSGQMLWAIVYSGIGMIISSTLSGVLVENFGMKISIFVFVSIEIVAMALLYIYNMVYSK